MVLECVAWLVGVAALFAIERGLAASAARAFSRAYLGAVSSSAPPAPSSSGSGTRSEISSLRRPIPQMKTMESQVGREGPWP